MLVNEQNTSELVYTIHLSHSLSLASESTRDFSLWVVVVRATHLAAQLSITK